MQSNSLSNNFAMQSKCDRIARRHHHGWQRPLGGAPRSAARRRSSCWRCGGTARCGARSGGGHWAPDSLRIFFGQLASSRRRRCESIFWLLRAFLRLERERLRQAGVRLEAIGRRDRLPKLLLREIDQAEYATAAGRRLHLQVAIDYSSRDAIARRGSWRVNRFL